MIRSLWLRGADYPKDAYSVREEVFVHECGGGSHQELDEKDEAAWHLVLYQDEVPIGTLRLFIFESSWNLDKICIKQEYRKQKYGDLLMRLAFRKLEELPQGEGVFLCCQENVQSFFERYGFESTGAYCQMEISSIQMKRARNILPVYCAGQKQK